MQHSENLKVMSQVERFATFALSHPLFTLEGISATIIAIIVIWLFMNLQQEGDEEKLIKSQEIETLLKKVLATTPTATGPFLEKSSSNNQNLVSGTAQTLPAPTAKSEINMTASVAAPSPAGTATPAPVIETPGNTQIVEARSTNTSKEGGEDVSKLRDNLENRNQKVDALEKQLEAAKDELKKVYENKPAASDAMDELKKQIQTLEGRLHEYSIIEDDIANLSSYKDENLRLKEEVERLKRKGTGSQSLDYAKASPPQVPLVEAPASPEVSALEEVAEEESEPEPAAPLRLEPLLPDPPLNLPPKVSKGPAWPINENETKKLMQEFDSLMGTQTPAAAVTEIIDHSNAKEGEKLIADFENFMKGTSG
jgi:hypothetical protein